MPTKVKTEKLEKAKCDYKEFVPRWVFLTSMSALVTVALAFAGWNISSIKAISARVETKHIEFETDISDQLKLKIEDSQKRYTQDVDRFINAVRGNRSILEDLRRDIELVKIKQGQISVKQDLVIEKIGLTDDN